MNQYWFGTSVLICLFSRLSAANHESLHFAGTRFARADRLRNTYYCWCLCADIGGAYHHDDPISEGIVAVMVHKGRQRRTATQRVLTITQFQFHFMGWSGIKLRKRFIHADSMLACFAFSGTKMGATVGGSSVGHKMWQAGTAPATGILIICHASTC
jgi:hypothetical protein